MLIEVFCFISTVPLIEFVIYCSFVCKRVALMSYRIV